MKHFICLCIGMLMYWNANAQYNAKGYQIATNNQYYDLPITAEVNPDGNIKTVQTRLLFAQKTYTNLLQSFKKLAYQESFLL